MDALFTRMIADGLGKPAFFFSRFYFDRMKEHGNTHYCFNCGGQQGFTPGPNGEATNSSYQGYDPMERHNPATHASAIIANADKYDWVGDWLRKEISNKPEFPYIVSVPSV